VLVAAAGVDRDAGEGEQPAAASSDWQRDAGEGEELAGGGCGRDAAMWERERTGGGRRERCSQETWSDREMWAREAVKWDSSAIKWSFFFFSRYHDHWSSIFFFSFKYFCMY